MEERPYVPFYENYAFPDLWRRYDNRQTLKEVEYPDWLIFKETEENQKHKKDFADWFKQINAREKIQFYEGVVYVETFNHPIFQNFPLNVEEWGARNFIPNLNKKFTFSELLHINMPNLTLLALCENKISNIEALVYLKTPKLKEVDLTDNNIRNLKALKKISFKIDRILLYENPIVDPSSYGFLQRSERGTYIGFSNQIQSPTFLAKVPQICGQVLRLLKLKFTTHQETQFDEEEIDYYRRMIKSQQKLVNCLLKKK